MGIPCRCDQVKLKTACLLLGLFHAASAAAIGLGDLDVRSYLGQPLHVTVRIIGADAKTSADCFSLGPSEGSAVPPPRRAQLSLEKSGDRAVLHIRTPYTMDEPVAQFELISDCDARLRRDYVVLLDPPAAIEAVPERTPAVAIPREASAPRAVASRPATPARSTRSATAPARGGLPARQSAPRPQAAPSEAPRLVLSGRPGTGASPLALRLDTNLPDLNRSYPDRLTPTELSDENTALGHKLAYLQAQLASLQQRNAELEGRRATQTPQPARAPSSSQPPRWPFYLLAIGLLTGAGALVVRLRSRSRHGGEGVAGSWHQADAMAGVDLESTESGRRAESPSQRRPAAEQTMSTRPPAPTAPQPIAEPSFETIPPTMDQSTEVKDDILDQAEVYVAHGHGDLAVHLLQEHLRDSPLESPVPWLLLLDLLHRESDTEGYAAASAECHRHFNINLSGHPVSQDGESSRGLESYPHLTEKLVEVWGSPDIEAFFDDLIFDRRGGTRIGFEPGAYREILLLRAIALEALPRAA